MKAYITGNTGTGKTLLAGVFGLYYRQNHNIKTHKIYANLGLNIPGVVYTQFGFIPYSKVIKGNSLVILDDFKNLGNMKGFSTYLTTVSRKTNTQIIATVQYYTHIKKEMRDLFDYELIPKLTNLKYNKNKGIEELTSESELSFTPYNPTTLEQTDKTKVIPNILSIIKGIYNTREVVKPSTKRVKIQEIAKFSNNFHDIEVNVGICESSEFKQEKLIKAVCELKDIPYIKC